jgi:hypothetical protein
MSNVKTIIKSYKYTIFFTFLLLWNILCELLIWIKNQCVVEEKENPN